MFKAIFAFIKAHTIVTVITTTAVVGTAVAAPIVVKQIENQKIEIEKKDNVAKVNQIVNDNLDLLIKEDDVIITEDNEIEEKHTEESNQVMDNTKPQQEKEQVNTNEPLTFRIEKVRTTTPGGSGTITMEGEAATTMESTGISYKIVPSYDKDPEEWTDVDKEAYSRAVQEIANMAKSDYEDAIKREEQLIKEMEEQLQQEIEKYN